MTTMLMNNDIVDLLVKIICFATIWFCVHISLKMMFEISKHSKKREMMIEYKQLYTARKHQFEDKPLEWKKWRDANYKITDLVEADTYY